MEVAPCSKRYHRQTSARWYAESVFLRYLSSAAFVVLSSGKLHIATCTLMECTWHNSSCIALELWRALHTHWIRRHLLYQWFKSTGRSWIWSHWWFLPTMGHHPMSLHCQRRDIKNCDWTAPKLATWNRSHVVNVLGWCFKSDWACSTLGIPNSYWNSKVNPIGYHFPWLLIDVDALIHIKSWVSLFVVLRVTLTERLKEKKIKSLGVTWPLLMLHLNSTNI